MVNEELESDDITALKGLTSIIHCNASKIASIFPVYTDNPSLIPLLILMLKSGTMEA